MSLAAQGEHRSTGGSCWGKSLFKIATLFLVGELLYLDQNHTLRWATFRNAKLWKYDLLWKNIVRLFFAPFTETWDGNSSALKLGQDAGFYSVFNEMKAVEIPTRFNTRRKMKWHGNKHSFQCWTCSVGYFWSWWNNKFNWQNWPWKQLEESQCGCQGGRVKGRKRHAKNATESAQAEKPGNWGTRRAVLSLVLGFFCFYKGCYFSLQLFGIIIIRCKDPY